MIQKSVNQMLGFLAGAAAMGQRAEAKMLDVAAGDTVAAEKRQMETSGMSRSELFAERDKERRARGSSIIETSKAIKAERAYAEESEAATGEILKKTGGLTLPEYQKRREAINKKAQATRAKNRALKEEQKKKEAKEAAALLARGKILTAEQAAAWLAKVKGGATNV